MSRRTLDSWLHLKANRTRLGSALRSQDDPTQTPTVRLPTDDPSTPLREPHPCLKEREDGHLLLDGHGFPVCVLEAKRERIHPLTSKEQARDYAKGKNARFVILSNGLSHYLWDTDGGNPEVITELPTQGSLQHRSIYMSSVDDLISEKVGAAAGQ